MTEEILFQSLKHFFSCSWIMCNGLNREKKLWTVTAIKKDLLRKVIKFSSNLNQSIEN